ncbi:ROK family protein [Candidatus Nanohalococcus occultus]|uniref:Glucokinase n=1 Tax=Candidatus Nanohalococcus occultus TaxID=2978047 RepID=A0ABY8CI52_9ARCH|nr:Glucokinase [Candidatus Nanohaloarchaeota archaeon SVXNc]
MAFLCVDIGGTNTLIGVGNGEFQITRNVKTENFLERVDENIEDALSEAGYRPEDVGKVAAAVAGPLDRKEGVFRPPNIDDLDEVQIVEPLENFGEVVFVNDCTSAVAGEYYYGDDELENIAYITISSGIGMGAVIDGEIVEGWNGNLGEVGHMVVGSEGIKCGCGGTDHWEAYCSGNGMPKLAEKLFGAEFQDSLEIFQSCDLGEENACKTIEKVQEYNKRGFMNIIDLFNPGKVYVGGAVALNHFNTVVEEPVDEIGSETINEVPEFEKSTLGDEVVLHGLRAVCNGEFELSS